MTLKPEGNTDMCGDAQEGRMVTLKVTLDMTLLMTNDKCKQNYTSYI